MPYFRIDDKLHSHRKTLRASVPAMGLWALAGSWCMDQQTDGWVPDYAALRLDPQALEHAAELVRAGYWHEAERDGDKGWLFHEWDEWQHSAEYLRRRRQRNTERMRTKRANDAASEDQQDADQQEQPVRAHTASRAHDVDSTPTTTQPKKDTRKRDTAAAGASADFDTWWQHYPRKVGKTAAAKAYDKARRTVDADTLLAGLHAATAGWRACGTEQRFIPHPSTWLNEGRWEDQEQLPMAHQGVTRTDPAAAVQATYDMPPLPAPPPDLSGREAQAWLRERRAEQVAALQAKGGARA